MVALLTLSLSTAALAAGVVATMPLSPAPTRLGPFEAPCRDLAGISSGYLERCPERPRRDRAHGPRARGATFRTVVYREFTPVSVRRFEPQVHRSVSLEHLQE